jgi:CheY-like chemotaxis protein
MNAVLVVEADPAARRRMGGWLADAGYEVIMCPGPQAPDYTCLGGRGLPCPLPAIADVVVLDLELKSDWVYEGTPGWRLLSYYQSRGKPVVALTGDGVLNLEAERESLITIPRSSDQDRFLRAVGSLLRESNGRGADPSTEEEAADGSIRE